MQTAVCCVGLAYLRNIILLGHTNLKNKRTTQNNEHHVHRCNLDLNIPQKLIDYEIRFSCLFKSKRPRQRGLSN